MPITRRLRPLATAAMLSACAASPALRGQPTPTTGILASRGPATLPGAIAPFAQPAIALTEAHWSVAWVAADFRGAPRIHFSAAPGSPQLVDQPTFGANGQPTLAYAPGALLPAVAWVGTENDSQRVYFRQTASASSGEIESVASYPTPGVANLSLSHVGTDFPALLWSRADGTESRIVAAVRRDGAWQRFTPEAIPGPCHELLPAFLDNQNGGIGWFALCGGNVELLDAPLTPLGIGARNATAFPSARRLPLVAGGAGTPRVLAWVEDARQPQRLLVAAPGGIVLDAARATTTDTAERILDPAATSTGFVAWFARDGAAVTLRILDTVSGARHTTTVSESARGLRLASVGPRLAAVWTETPAEGGTGAVAVALFDSTRGTAPNMLSTVTGPLP